MYIYVKKTKFFVGECKKITAINRVLVIVNRNIKLDILV